MNCKLIMLAACSSLFSSGLAYADLIYVFEQSNYTVTPNGTLDVKLFLTQTGVTDVLTSEGLDSIGGRIFFNNSPSASSPAVVLTTDDIVPSDAFADPFENLDLVPLISAGLEDSIAGTDPVFGPSILVGTFRFTAGSVLGEVTHLRATDFDPTPGNSSIVSGLTLNGLDGLLGADATAKITVSAVPEPSSVVLLCAGLLGILTRRRRKDLEGKTSQRLHPVH